MRVARMHGYHEPLRLEEIPTSGRTSCSSKWRQQVCAAATFSKSRAISRAGAPLSFPATPGHEVAGRIAAIGTDVPRSAGLAEGDLVVVDPNWGDRVCRQCHEGNEQICANGTMLGFGPPGGFAEYMPVPHRNVIGVPDNPDQKPEILAPLTDAGLTPYRGMKKLRDAGKLGAGRTVVVNGIGGLGSYAVQYARLLGGGATVVAFARSDEKLSVAKENGAHHTVDTRDKTVEDVQNELRRLTVRRDVDAVLDCA